MGMFDTIYCKVPLPENSPFDSTTPFQTKSIDEPVMTTYVIEEDGRLMHRTGYYETVPENERPYPEGHKLAFIGSIRFIETGWEPVDIHARVVFYASVGDVWYDYEATFTHGQLEELKLKGTEVIKRWSPEEIASANGEPK